MFEYCEYCGRGCSHGGLCVSSDRSAVNARKRPIADLRLESGHRFCTRAGEPAMKFRSFLCCVVGAGCMLERSRCIRSRRWIAVDTFPYNNPGLCAVPECRRLEEDEESLRTAVGSTVRAVSGMRQ